MKNWGIIEALKQTEEHLFWHRASLASLQPCITYRFWYRLQKKFRKLNFEANEVLLLLQLQTTFANILESQFLVNNI